MQARSVTVESQLLGETIRQAVAQGGSFVLTVTGSSMCPTLKPGRDQVCLTAPGKIRKGDILFFRREHGGYVLHRCIGMKNGIYIVNGDSQNWTEAVLPEQIVAVASRICRKGRWMDCGSVSLRLYGCLWPATRKLRPALIRLKGRLIK